MKSKMYVLSTIVSIINAAAATIAIIQDDYAAGAAFWGAAIWVNTFPRDKDIT